MRIFLHQVAETTDHVNGQDERASTAVDKFTRLRCVAVKGQQKNAAAPSFKMEHAPHGESQNRWLNDDGHRIIRQAKKYLYQEKLTPTIPNDMINAVYVHTPDKSSGHRVQDVTISYNYIGKFPANLLLTL